MLRFFCILGDDMYCIYRNMYIYTYVSTFIHKHTIRGEYVQLDKCIRTPHCLLLPQSTVTQGTTAV